MINKLLFELHPVDFIFKRESKIKSKRERESKSKRESLVPDGSIGSCRGAQDASIPIWIHLTNWYIIIYVAPLICLTIPKHSGFEIKPAYKI